MGVLQAAARGDPNSSAAANYSGLRKDLTIRFETNSSLVGAVPNIKECLSKSGTASPSACTCHARLVQMRAWRSCQRSACAPTGTCRNHIVDIITSHPQPSQRRAECIHAGKVGNFGQCNTAITISNSGATSSTGQGPQCQSVKVKGVSHGTRRARNRKAQTHTGLCL